MNEKDFLENYLWPSGDKLDRTFIHPLPKIEGLKKCGDFIVQSELEDTFSTNIITKYESDTTGIRLVELYKNSQNQVTGVFVRLVGSLSLVKNGYPFLFLDASIKNVSVVTAEEGRKGITVEDITTTVYIFLPQADLEQRKMFFDHLKEQAKEVGISYSERRMEKLPDSEGTVLLAESEGIDLDIIPKLRDHAWNSYKRVIEQTKEKKSFDYRSFQEYIIFDIARQEHLSFGRRGLSVPVEAQAAFFSVMVSGI